MLWKSALAQVMDAAHWTAILTAGMLAVVFLVWALEVTVPQIGRAANGGANDETQDVGIWF